MHRLIQRGKVRSQVISVPEGLPELLSDITREVLRCQPTTECLCQFIIDYLHSVTATRDKSTIVKSVIDQALSIVDDVITDMCICDIPKEKANYMCEAMEECFRRFLDQRRCEQGKNKEIIKFNEFDMLDELIRKCKFTDDELKISKPLIEAAYQKFVNVYLTAKETSDGTDSLYQYLREREIVRLEQRLKEESAIKIQCLFRGYLLRKSLFVDMPVKIPIPLSLGKEDDKIKQEMAASKIQQFFRRQLSVLKSANVEKYDEINSQDPCTPTSDISLTARPARHHDTNEENYDTNINDAQNNDNEIQKELIPEQQADPVTKDEEISVTGEVTAEKNNDTNKNDDQNQENEKQDDLVIEYEQVTFISEINEEYYETNTNNGQNHDNEKQYDFFLEEEQISVVDEKQDDLIIDDEQVSFIGEINEDNYDTNAYNDQNQYNEKQNYQLIEVEHISVIGELTNEESYDTNRNDDQNQDKEIQKELTPEKQGDSQINRIGEVSAEEQIANEDYTEKIQND